MASRGQRSFVNLPGFAAKLYSGLTRTRAFQRTLREVAAELASRITRGRILDVGAGPGRLLFEFHRLNPAVELYGLDISAAMVELARRKLSGLGANIRQGDIQHAGYEDDFFDLVTCTGSFYLWDHPEECLEEIFRILKPHQSAYLFETYRDCDRREVRKAIRTNLQGENLVRQALAPQFFMGQLRMTYDVDEFAGIIQKTSFARNYAIDRIVLAGLPAWLRIKLAKIV